ncbi:NADPH-dependent F420 reductase [Aquabacter sp. CN5-332]|uniref:NADPH-dependent F420 reductase n=1 Tax=Aquabacter sp. CN5-332 TaxID=3156608 RepID=UPI0032B570BB
MSDDLPKIAILGGTGDLGSGLAKRLLAAGYGVTIGSRSREKAQAFAATLGAHARGADMRGATMAGDVVILSVPWASHGETLAEIHDLVQGKILLDAVVPLVPPKVATVQLPKEGSAAQIAQELLGEGVRVISAFHNIGAAKLHAGEPIECDVLVCGNDKDARELGIALANAVGATGIDAGVLANSAAVEAMTSVLIGINRRYKVKSAGVKITGLS